MPVSSRGEIEQAIVSFILSLVAAAFYSVSSAILSRALGLPKHQLEPQSTTRSLQHLDAPADRLSRYRKTILGFATAALVIHGWVVIHQTGLPYSLTLPIFTSISATTLTIVLLHIFLCLKQPADYLGIAIYPIAGVSLIASQASGGGTEIISDAVEIHVFLSLLAYAVLALAATQAVLVSIQRHFLSRHKPGGFIRALPPLDTTEQLLFTLLAIGFVLLSLSLASGFFYLEDMFSQRLVHKTVLSCLGWGIFGFLIFGRWRFGWRGKKVVHWTIGGFAVLVLAYFGTKIVVEILLS